MNITIVGAGIIGLTSAWFLEKAGYKVTVIDKYSGPSLGTSKANGGMLSVGHSAPNVKPGVISMTLKNLFSKDPFMHIAPDFTWQQIRWLFASLKEATNEKFALNQMRMINIAALSRQALREIEAEADFHYDKREGGIMQLCQNDAQMKAAEAQQKGLNHYHIDTEILTKSEVIAHEPGLAEAKKNIVGGIRLIHEETGDSKLFAENLEKCLKAKGVIFHYDTEITEIIHNQNSINCLRSHDQEFTADNYVFAIGADSYRLLKSLVYLPVYPVKGYSLTFPIIDEALAPQYSVFDTIQNVAITRFDHNVRVAGYAGIEGFNQKLKAKQLQVIKDNYLSWFPNATKTENIAPWAGFRPMTPDGTPIISDTPIDNLYVNTGHGTFGWTMSCGSAKLLASLISKEPVDIDIADYSLNRYK